MILLLGATGYVGQAFARALQSRNQCFIPLSRHAFDYTRFELLFDYVRKIKPELVVNAADCAEHWHAEASELDRLEMLQANTLLPQTVSRVCSMTNTPWAHVSSGRIYSGAKVFEHSRTRVERDLNRPVIRQLFEQHPEQFFGFTESDEPNFSFKFGPCAFYSGTKALAEEAIRTARLNYIWRFCLVFNEQSEPSNFLYQLQQAAHLSDGINSLSHLDDCVGACLELWDRRAPYGIYNVANPGAVSIQEVVSMIQRIRKPTLWQGGAPQASTTDRLEVNPLRSHCILDVRKLLTTGVRLRHVKEALERSLVKWQPHASEIVRALANGLPVAR